MGRVERDGLLSLAEFSRQELLTLKDLTLKILTLSPLSSVTLDNFASML